MEVEMKMIVSSNDEERDHQLKDVAVDDEFKNSDVGSSDILITDNGEEEIKGRNLRKIILRGSGYKGDKNPELCPWMVKLPGSRGGGGGHGSCSSSSSSAQEINKEPIIIVPRKKRTPRFEDVEATKALNYLDKLQMVAYESSIRPANPKETFSCSSKRFAAKKRKNPKEREDDVCAAKKKMKGLQKIILMDPQPKPVFPQDLKNSIVAKLGGSDFDPVLVIQKSLFQTDLSHTHDRLSMPASKINQEFLEKFLRKDEISRVRSKGHLEVTLINPNLEEFRLKFTNWNMNSTIYVLMSQWKRVVHELELKVGMVVQIWAFRIESVIYLALLSIVPEGNQIRVDDGASTSHAHAHAHDHDFQQD